MPKVSIIVPCYNVQNYVESCLYSIIGQSFIDYEIIIVDDGSTDNTSKIIYSFIKKYQDKINIKYIYQNNKGASAARNRGIIESSSEYIALIDSDDRWRKDSLEKKMELFKNRNISCVYSDVLMIHSPEKQISLKNTYKKLIKGNIYPEILEHNYININVIIKKTVLDECGLFDESLKTCEDYDLWIRIASKGYLFDFVDDPLTYVTIRKDSLSKDILQMYSDMLIIFNKILKASAMESLDYKIALDRKKYFEKLYYEELFVNLVLKRNYEDAKSALKTSKIYYNSFMKYYFKYYLFSFYPNYFFKKFNKMEGAGN